jgi:hypothetical protein
MFGMQWDQVSALVRHILTFGGGYFIAQGIVDEATMTTIISGGVALIGVIWSLRDKTAKKPPVA